MSIGITAEAEERARWLKAQWDALVDRFCAAMVGERS